MLFVFSFFGTCFCSGEKWAYSAVHVHASSIADCFMGKCFIVVCLWISYSFSSRYNVHFVGDLPHAWYFRRWRW